MDLSERRTDKRHSGAKLPRVPIKTYKWEDVRRSRRRGGYPWTHLYKNSFDDLTDPENFTMDGLKKNKSSASSASDSLDIREITEDDVKGLEHIDSSYVVIESPILLGGQIEESPNDQEMTIESAESSDNISQYLDKEERGPEQQLESTETLRLPGPSTPKILLPEEFPKERAKSEEPERKRKLSMDSNYSRISLSRLGLMKRLKEAKGKIKLPKLGGSPKSETKAKPKTEEIEPAVQKEVSTKPHKVVNPVYIHIPLKPPEGETDEFSYLEFEEKRPKLPSPPEIQIEVSEDKENDGSTSNIAESDSKDERAQVESSDNMLKIGSPDDQDDDVSAIIFLEGDEESENKGEYDIMVVDINEKSQEMTMSQVTNTEVRRQVLDSIKRVESQAELSKSQDKNGSGGNLSRSSSKGSKTSKSSIRKRRAKSAEPETKRRLSIDSSYSRKSLSKIGLLKKLKQFHLPFKKSQSKKSIKSVSSTEKAVVPAAASHDVFKPHAKDQKPVYIHIPLKPPTGEQDEFSHLEFETAPPPKQKIEKSDSNEAKEEEKSPIESPESVQSPQFIFLTPPSDDELLEKPDIPETPSSETGSLFQFGELKILAKKAVEQIHGNLDAVDEEAEPKIESTSVITEAVVEHQSEKQKEETIECADVTVDEEDGLKCAPRSADDAKSALKSNLKGDCSPVPKKKVSFKKRKPSQVSTDDGYEEIQSPTETPQLEPAVVQNVTEISKNEEPSHSDKSAKSSLVEEVVNRWSKISDHEYEPINPPSDERKEVSPPKFHVSEVLNSSSGTPQHPEDEQFDFSIQEMQTEIETRFFRNDNAATTVDSTTENLDPSKRSSRSRSKEKEPAKPNKFQIALKESATKFKTKLQGIKKPNFSLPTRPKFHKPNIKKPNIKKPNITMPKINLPKLPDLSNTFRRREKSEEKKSEMETMSSENPEKNAQGIFSFSTYPRLFKKKKRDYDSGSLKGKAGSLERKKKEVKVKPTKRESPPQTAGNNSADTIRIPLHSKESMDQENGLFPLAANMEEDYTVEEEKESPRRYQEDIDTDDEQDAIQRERQEKHRAAVEAASQPEESRWKHGNFFNVQNGTGHHYDDEEPADEEIEEENPEDYEVDYEHQEIVTDLDQPEETHQPSIPTRQKLKLEQHDSIDTNHSRDVGSSVSSLGQHRRGVLEEIDSDQFFLREKGISQDNIDMGRYLSTEIREAFRVPANALADMHAYNYTEMRDSNQSLPETKRKPIKKPKRRKTPHTSQERLRYEPESENDDYNFMPPTRPKRRSKRRSRPEDNTEEVIPYIETISVEPAKVEDRDKFSRYYENNELGGVEYRDMGMSQPYNNMLYVQESIHRRASEPIPAAPPRKHKSLKSLNASEHESIFNDYDNEHENKKVNGYPNQDAFMSSRMDEASISAKHDGNIQGPNRPPKPPSRSRSKTKSMSRGTSQADSMFDRTDSIMYDEELREPVVEEPFVQDLRDAMGYAIVDKSQLKNWEHKCCTVPRSHGKDKDGAPERPLRNYSTLGPSRPPRKLSRNMTDEEKENIDITQYIEIDDDRGLQSGEVIQKMQNRPLPAPPRPPRLRTKPLNDISSEENVMVFDDVREKEITEEEVDGNQIDETEVSTQTEPLPADFVCEEVVQEETDKIMTPSVLRKNGSPRLDKKDTHPTENQAEVTKTDDIKVETKLITPTRYTYEEETITHGQLLVEPLNGAQILPNAELSRERIIPITSDEEDTSEIPESFDRLLNPDEIPPLRTHQEPQKPPRVQTPHGTQEKDVLKTQKLKVSDLDVDRLTVNELVANKIIVSEIESGNITTHDINSKSGALKLTDIELEPSIVKKLLEQLQESSKKHQSILEEDTASANLEDSQVEEKKTPIDFRVLETSTSQDSTTTIVPSMRQNSTTSEIQENTTDILTELQEQEINCEPALIKDEFIPENCEVSESEINESKDICDEKCVEPLIGEVFEEKLDVLGETPTVLGSENEEPPVRPPRSFEKKNSPNEIAVSEDDQRELNSEFCQSEDDTGQEDAPVEFAENSSGFRYSEMFEPEIDDEPPPRPPQPQVPYVPSQPPPSFYALRAHHYVENISEDIPLVPRRKRHHRIATISRSSSSEAEGVPAPRRRVRTPEPSISQLSLQLVCACGTSARNMIKRLIEQLNGKFADSSNAGSDSSRHNVQVIIVILLVLIAGLLLLGYGDGRTVHLHHWEYFNPPKDI